MAAASRSDVKMLQVSQLNSDVAEREFVLKIIEFYRQNPVLWNSNNEHYTNKYRRICALRRICDDLKAYKPQYTVEDLKKKLNILRTNFKKERNKIEMRKSMLPGHEPEPILWYYNEMTFLIGQDTSTPAEIPMMIKDSAHTNKLLRNLKTKKLINVTELSGSKKAENDEDILLAKCWAVKLKKLAPDQRLYAEKIINDTLFEAELGTLTRHGASFNSTPTVWTEYAEEPDSSPDYKSPPS